MNRIITAGWHNFIRNSYLSVGTIGVMVMSLVVCMGLIAMQFLTSTIVNTLQDKVDISIYFKNDALEDQIFKVREDIKHIPEVTAVTYVGRDQALNDFKKKHEQDALIQESLDQLQDNPLTASLNIKARNASQYTAIAQAIERNTFRSIIDKINFYENKDVINRIQKISENINNGVLISTIILACIAIFVTFNTIRLTIYNQKKEIEIMRLVGASNWHIRGPHLTEGAFYGLFSAGLSLLFFYPTLYLISDKISSFTSVNLFTYFVGSSLEVAALVLALGVSLGIISSFIAIHKYLKI